MNINFFKHYGGTLVPADEYEHEKMNKFKTGEVYSVDIKLSRNPGFLRKAMVFFHFCFEHWNGEKVLEYADIPEQFDRFRKDLTILSGFYVRTTRLNGDIRIEAESLSFASMTEERFQECYNALINAAMKHLFKSTDETIYNQLISFF